MNREVDVLAPPPVIFGAALGAGLVLNAALPSPEFRRAVAVPAGAALAVGGGLLAGSFLRAFRHADTPVDFRAVTALVTTGPYRFSRNPGYVGLAMAHAGVALLAGAPWALATLPGAVAVVDRMVIAREERYLERRFGDEYRRYTTRVRRWL